MDIIVEIEEVLPPETIEVVVDPNAAQSAIDAAAIATAALAAIQALIDGFNPENLTPYFETVTYVAGNPQTFDLGLDITPMVVVINEGRFLKHGTEWIMAGSILTILYDSLEDGDNVSVNGFEGTMNDVAPVYSGDVGPDVGPDVG
jgi:hypothetical protein